MPKSKRSPEVVVADLFSALEHFGNLFTAEGALPVGFNRVQDLLLELRDIDPKYQGKLGVAKPFGQDIHGEMMKFLVSQYLGGRWYTDTELVSIVTRLFEQVGVPGNPLNEN